MTACKQEPVIENLISSKPSCNSKYYICLRDCIPNFKSKLAMPYSGYP